ncbi:MAG: RagB/SusD family nutrient uptake outer membrane protein [Prevotella sp.]|nr:RagB/SusD family nutrient uptake outer membrane protein [Prevotella sp.]
MNSKIRKRQLIGLSFIICHLSFSVALTSCDDFFNQESNDVLYDNQEHLDNAVDSAWSVVGILGKLQLVADRTVVLGEVRGDLVDLSIAASSDLRDVANFNVGDDNKYNNPTDYYAVINNCNYFLAHVDTSLRSRNEPIFMAEWAAVKGIRAWTYLQLALNYGKVPLITEPLLSREDAEAAEKGHMAGIEDICTYFIDDLSTVPARYNNDFPLDARYITVTNVNSTELLFFPVTLLKAELYLWRATVTKSVNDYKQAALNYFQFISERNGTSAPYPTKADNLRWRAGSTEFSSPAGTLDYLKAEDLISVIPGNSSPTVGFYSELNNLFCSNDDNNYQVSLLASQRIFDISEAQDYCLPATNAQSYSFVPKGLRDYQSGDLRLSRVYDEDYEYDPFTEERIRTKYISKHRSTNVTVYRRIMVYLHLAEALNGAGYPRMAYLILSTGLSNRQIKEQAMPYYMTDDRADSLYLAQFNFDDRLYRVCTFDDYNGISTEGNQLGIHSRGSGWTPLNDRYALINDTIEPDLQKRQQLVAEQQLFVDSLLLNENALELAFEGARYYDLMRFAMRQSNPAAFMADHIFARRGEDKRAEVQGEVKTDFADRSTWFLKWNGKIGLME